MGFSLGRGIAKKRGTDFNQETIGYPEYPEHKHRPYLAYFQLISNVIDFKFII